MSNRRKEIIDQIFDLCSSTANESYKFDNFLELYKLIETLTDLEKDIKCVHVLRDAESFCEFFKYLNENSVNTNKIEIEKYNEKDYGIKAKENVGKGDSIFEIPKSLMMTIEDAYNSELGPLIKSDKLLLAMPNVTLAFYLLYETFNSNSKWNAYINILPSSDSLSTPLYFTLNEIKLLSASQSFSNNKNSSFLFDFLLHIRNVVRQYAYLYRILFSQSNEKLNQLKNNFSYNNYRWSVSIITTRQNRIIDQYDNQLYALIPLFDMCNYEDEEMCNEYDKDKQKAIVYAINNIAAGDEVKIFYGQRNNRDMLIHNGFVPENNCYNSTYLRLGLSASDPLFKHKLAVLVKFGMTSTESFEIRVADQHQPSIPQNAYVFVKIFLLKTDDELRNILTIKNLNSEKYFNDNKLITDNDVRQFLKLRFNLLLKSYDKLKSTNEFDNSTNGVFIKRLLLSEQNIIRYICENVFN